MCDDERRTPFKLKNYNFCCSFVVCVGSLVFDTVPSFIPKSDDSRKLMGVYMQHKFCCRTPKTIDAKSSDDMHIWLMINWNPYLNDKSFENQCNTFDIWHRACYSFYSDNSLTQTIKKKTRKNLNVLLLFKESMLDL